jgi:hypothetical protein
MWKAEHKSPTALMRFHVVKVERFSTAWQLGTEPIVFILFERCWQDSFHGCASSRRHS